MTNPRYRKVENITGVRSKARRREMAVHQQAIGAKTGLVTVFYCLKFETLPKWRARALYLYFCGIAQPSAISRHWVKNSINSSQFELAISRLVAEHLKESATGIDFSLLQLDCQETAFSVVEHQQCRRRILLQECQTEHQQSTLYFRNDPTMFLAKCCMNLAISTFHCPIKKLSSAFLQADRISLQFTV